MLTGLGYYSEQQYSLLLRYADDRIVLHDTWQEWLLKYEETYAYLKANGILILRIEVDINQLLRYCHKNGLKNTQETRSKYIQEKTSEQNH